MQHENFRPLPPLDHASLGSKMSFLLDGLQDHRITVHNPLSKPTGSCSSDKANKSTYALQRSRVVDHSICIGDLLGYQHLRGEAAWLEEL